LLLIAGAAAALGPLYIGILGWNVQLRLPYSFAWRTLAKMLPAGGDGEQAKAVPGYIAQSKKLVPFSEQWPRVLRYYGYLILPIVLALSGIVLRIYRTLWSLLSKLRRRQRLQPRPYDRFVLLFGLWWVLDMAFVWISPRSYEQYYLPLNASAAMLSGYASALFVERLRQKSPLIVSPARVVLDFLLLAVGCIVLPLAVRGVFLRIADPKNLENYGQFNQLLAAAAVFMAVVLVGPLTDLLTKGANKAKWVLGGSTGFVCALIMCWPVLFGVRTSPHTGLAYGGKQRGYAQRLSEVSNRRRKGLKGYWEIAGLYIRSHSQPTDKIYVWGWFPGIYVVAQRFAPTAPAFMMPRPAPPVFERRINRMVEDFRREPPKFIVDSRKRHIPTERPPYELWPVAPRGFQGARQPHFVRTGEEADSYDAWWSSFLRRRFDEEEALRYEALKPLRQFIMQNYRLVEPELFVPIRGGSNLAHRDFGMHVLFELKEATGEEGRP